MATKPLLNEFVHVILCLYAPSSTPPGSEREEIVQLSSEQPTTLHHHSKQSPKIFTHKRIRSKVASETAAAYSPR